MEAVCEPHFTEVGAKVQRMCVTNLKSHSLEALRCNPCLLGSEPAFASLPPLPSGLWSHWVLKATKGAFPVCVMQQCFRQAVASHTGCEAAHWVGHLKMESLALLNAGLSSSALAF